MKLTISSHIKISVFNKQNKNCGGLHHINLTLIRKQDSYKNNNHKTWLHIKYMYINKMYNIKQRCERKNVFKKDWINQVLPLFGCNLRVQWEIIIWFKVHWIDVHECFMIWLFLLYYCWKVLLCQKKFLVKVYKLSSTCGCEWEGWRMVRTGVPTVVDSFSSWDLTNWDEKNLGLNKRL